MQKLLERLLVILLIFIWLSHLMQVFTPEIGFDAVWYHLPVIKEIIAQKSLVFMPDLYQSVNPLLSDLILGFGFMFAGELGTKLVAYIFGLVLSLLTYNLSKQFLDKFWSLIVVILVSTFQVVAWQSASFYVDAAKAVWELASISALLKWHSTQDQKWLVASGLLLGASLATKLFSIFLLPAFLGMVWHWSKRNKTKNLAIFSFGTLVPPLPFYGWAYFNTGQPFYSFTQHLAKLGEIGGESLVGGYLLNRTLALPTLPYEVIFGRDYTSFVLILFLPILLMMLKKLKTDIVLWSLLGLTIFQLFLWWYLPPLSTRYALSGFILWTILSIWSAKQLIGQAEHFYWPIMISILLAIGTNLVPRIAVNFRSLKYLTGRQTKQEYLQQFLDGNIDQHLKRWHRL